MKYDPTYIYGVPVTPNNRREDVYLKALSNQIVYFGKLKKKGYKNLHETYNTEIGALIGGLLYLDLVSKNFEKICDRNYKLYSAYAAL